MNNTNNLKVFMKAGKKPYQNMKNHVKFYLIKKINSTNNNHNPMNSTITKFIKIPNHKPNKSTMKKPPISLNTSYKTTNNNISNNMIIE